MPNTWKQIPKLRIVASIFLTSLGLDIHQTGLYFLTFKTKPFYHNKTKQCITTSRTAQIIF